MAVTISDVAKAAGVGVGTVSRVLNNSQSVKESTRTKVLQKIAELNYSPDPIARSMITRRTGVLGVIIPFATRAFSMEVLRGMLNAASGLGYEVIIYPVEHINQRNHYFQQLPMRRRVDGMLVVSLSPEDDIARNFQEAGLLTVLVDAYNQHLTSLVINNLEGAYQAVKHLIDKGHRRIGFVNGITEGNFKFNQANDRLIGVHRAFGEFGIDFDPKLMMATDWDRAGGRLAAQHFLSMPNPPTAIFAASDVQAAGVLETARQLGVSVPGDLSLIGFDGIELSEILELSTMEQPMHLMGEMGVHKLMELLEDENKVPELIRLDTKLVERRTTGNPQL